MRLPRFLRRWYATILAWHTPELGGALFDYKNGLWDKLCEWNTPDEAEEALRIVESMMWSGREEIYVVMIKCYGPKHRGFFIIHSPNKFWFHGFSEGVYGLVEAYTDTAHKCRKIADSMGYRRPDDVNCGSTESSHCG